jgi:hypothetical protein
LFLSVFVRRTKEKRKEEKRKKRKREKDLFFDARKKVRTRVLSNHGLLEK